MSDAMEDIAHEATHEAAHGNRNSKLIGLLISVLALFLAGGNQCDIALGLDDFLDHHRVATGGHDGTGHDTHAFTLYRRAAKRLAGECSAYDLERCRDVAGQIGVA